MTPHRKIARPRNVRDNACGHARIRGSQMRLWVEAGKGQDRAPGGECVCSFGATRVGSMIQRVRLHVTTDRFLAGRRGDKMWEAACDYAALTLRRLESRLHPAVLAEWICATAGLGRPVGRRSVRMRSVAGGRR